MRVGVNALFLIPGEVGGSEIYLTETLKALVRLRPDVEWVIFTNTECDALFRDLFAQNPQVRVESLSLRATNRYARILAEQTQLPLRARRAGLDILWSPGYTAPLLAGVPQAVSILDMQYRSHPEDLSLIARWTTHVLVTGAACRARRILAISAFSRDEIARHTGVPPGRIDITHLGVDPVFARPRDPAAEGVLRRQRLGFSEPYLLCVANSYPHKNLHALVEAFALVAGEFPHRLVLVGKPRLGEPLLQAAMKRAPVGRVARLEQVPRDDLVTLYQAADAFVFPSLYEGFGLPVLEAMMARVPVITTRCGSLPEVGGEAVTYADGRDSGDLARQIRHVLLWEERVRSSAVEAARIQAGQFTWQATAQATLQGLQAVLGNG